MRNDTSAPSFRTVGIVTVIAAAAMALVGCGGDAAEAGVSCLGEACEPTTKGGDVDSDNAVAAPSPTDGVKNGTETDVDCGGQSGVRCAEGRACLADADCEGACDYTKRCIAIPSCKVHFGGDTCGTGEVGDADAAHESCCRTLEVSGSRIRSTRARRCSSTSTR